MGETVECLIYIFKLSKLRNSRPEVFCKKGKKTLLKKRLQDRCFPMNLAKCLRKLFYIEQLRWLLLRWQLRWLLLKVLKYFSSLASKKKKTFLCNATFSKLTFLFWLIPIRKFWNLTRNVSVKDFSHIWNYMTIFKNWSGICVIKVDGNSDGLIAALRIE